MFSLISDSYKIIWNVLSYVNESEIRVNTSKYNKIDGSLILPHKTLENEPKLNVIYANVYTKYIKTLIHKFKNA